MFILFLVVGEYKEVKTHPVFLSDKIMGQKRARFGGESGAKRRFFEIRDGILFSCNRIHRPCECFLGPERKSTCEMTADEGGGGGKACGWLVFSGGRGG